MSRKLISTITIWLGVIVAVSGVIAVPLAPVNSSLSFYLVLAGSGAAAAAAALRKPGPHAEAAKPVINRIADVLPEKAPKDAVTLIRIDAAVKLGAGAMLGLGKAPRLSALALAGSVVPTTLAAHRFWEMDDPAERENARVHFVKNLGLLGGLLITAVDTAGKPSLGWRTRRAARSML